MIQTYEAALQRGVLAGLRVLGRGTFDCHGGAFVIVGSVSEPGRHHVVTEYPAGRWSCDCTAGRYGRMCQHAAIVTHDQQKREDLRAAVHEGIREGNRIADEEEATRRRQRERDTALPTYWTDNRPFSIWRS